MSNRLNVIKAHTSSAEAPAFSIPHRHSPFYTYAVDAKTWQMSEPKPVLTFARWSILSMAVLSRHA